MFRAELKALDEGEVQVLKNCIDRCPQIIYEKFLGDSTLLHLASQLHNVEIVEMLIKEGACVNIKDQHGCTPLHNACAKDQANVANILITNGADLNVFDENGYLPIHHCAQTGSVGLLNTLINSGSVADVKLQTTDKLQPIHIACKKGNNKIVEAMIERGADPSAREKFNYQPLHFAAQYGHFAIAQCLLNSGASVTAQDEFGITPLALARKYDHSDLVELFENHETSPVSTEVRDGTRVLDNSETSCKSLEGQIDINLFKESLKTATMEGDKSEVESILEKGLQSFSLSDPVGHSLSLHEASTLGLDDIVTLLLKYTSDTTITDAEGRTPLHLASENGHDTTVMKLIEYGFDVEALDKDGYRPLHCACQNGHKSVVNTLISHNANLNAPDNYGYTPQKIADMKQHSSIAKLLQNVDLPSPSSTSKNGALRQKQILRKQISAPTPLNAETGDSSNEPIPRHNRRFNSSIGFTNEGKNTWRRRLKKLHGTLLSILWNDDLQDTPSEDIGPAEMPYQQFLRNHYQTLVEKMDPADVINIMFAKSVLSKRRMEEIKCEQLIYDRNEKLIGLVYERNEHGFNVFVQALLDTNQQHLAKLLLL